VLCFVQIEARKIGLIFCNQSSVEGKDTKPVHLARFLRTSCLYRRKRMRIVWFSASTRSNCGSYAR
jgi:hypothetical protein